jgi:hypothetical protein
MLSVCVFSLLNFWMPEAVFKKLCVYIMAHEPITMAYYIKTSYQSVSMCILLSLLRNGLVSTSPRQRIHATIEELLEASFPIRSVSYEGRVRGSVFNILPSFFSYDYSRNPLKQMTDLPAPVGAHAPCPPPLVISHLHSWERNPSNISVSYFTMNPSEKQ